MSLLYSFIIQAVTQSYDLSTKHDVSVAEWINAINKLRPVAHRMFLFILDLV